MRRWIDGCIVSYMITASILSFFTFGGIGEVPELLPGFPSVIRSLGKVGWGLMSICTGYSLFEGEPLYNVCCAFCGSRIPISVGKLGGHKLQTRCLPQQEQLMFRVHFGCQSLDLSVECLSDEISPVHTVTLHSSHYLGGNVGIIFGPLYYPESAFVSLIRLTG